MENRGLRTASRHFQAALYKDRRWRVSTTRENIEALLTSGQTSEEWGKIQRWYWQVKEHPPSPNREVIEYASILRDELYMHHPL